MPARPDPPDEDDDQETDDPEFPDESDMDSFDEPGVMPCPYCRKLVSEDAEQCPHCRMYLSIEGPTRTTLPIWFWAGLIAAVLGVLVWLFMR